MNVDRPPVGAGRFYSGDTIILQTDIEKLFLEAEKLIEPQKKEKEELLALVAPHAGFVYSGIVAASAFLQLKEIKPRKKVFLIGSSHHTDFNGASIYTRGDYPTPLGTVKVDQQTANLIIENSSYFEFVSAAHAHEHCLEVLLPFLQYVWRNEFEIVPIIIATHNKQICEDIAKELQPWFNSDNLFVISTDLSHYPGYNDAVKVDNKTIDAVLTGKPENLLEQIKKNKALKIPNLTTSMCGWTSVLTLMYMAQNISNVEFKSILYQNSGDAKVYGETDSVVGYQSMGVYAKSQEFTLLDEEKKALIDIAHKSISEYLKKVEHLKPILQNFSKNLQTPTGAFVSIYLDGELMGCIGNIESHGKTLVEVVADVAVSAAFHDNRFPRLTNEQFNNIKLEISVLTPLKKIESLEEFELGRHGILIRKGPYSGTFLPQVANKTNWTKEEFIGHCSKDKAGLGWDGWKEAELFTYEAIIIKEN